MEISVIKEFVFSVILICAAMQDLKWRSISLFLLCAAGGLGVVFCILLNRTCSQIVLSCGIGILILGIGRLTGGGIGEGDGWFFVAAGLFCDWQKNMSLFLWGLFFCFLVSLLLVVIHLLQGRGFGTMRAALPFLPFLIPVELWIV